PPHRVPGGRHRRHLPAAGAGGREGAVEAAVARAGGRPPLGGMHRRLHDRPGWSHGGARPGAGGVSDDEVTLVAGGLRAAFIPGLAMVGSSLMHEGVEMLALRGGPAAYRERGATFGIPLLHPWRTGWRGRCRRPTSCTRTSTACRSTA